MLPHNVRAPRLRRALVSRTVAGLRPFRPAGFRVELEEIRGRSILHNYGHGGSGMTLAAGTAAMAAARAATTSHRVAAVIGAGAVGLMTARALQGQGFSVTVYGAAVSPDTTSDVAGALWGTFSLVDPAYATPATAARVAEASRLSHQLLTALPPARYGIRRVPLFLVGDAPALPWEMALTAELFACTLLNAGEHPFSTRGALLTESLMIEPGRFLSAVHADIIASGGDVVTRRFVSLDDVLSLDSPLLVNCAGLGARDLFGDTSLEPLKGEIALLEHQPAIDYAVVSLDDDAYVLPREGALVVGGSRVRGDWSLDVRDDEIDRILERARRLYR